MHSLLLSIFPFYLYMSYSAVVTAHREIIKKINSVSVLIVLKVKKTLTLTFS